MRATAARYPLTVSRTDASASRATRSTSAISAAARAGLVGQHAPASSLLSAMSDRLWPSVSWRSRAIRLRSSATASSASSLRAACSSRFAAAQRRRANRVSEIVPTVDADRDPGVEIAPAREDRASAEASERTRWRQRAALGPSRAAVTPA